MTEADVSVNEQEGTDDEVQGEELSDAEALQAKLKEAIEVSVESLGALRKKLTITVPREMIEEQLSEQYDELRHEALVPGFRKGRAPLKLLEKRFGSEVGERVGSSLISSSYLAAVDRESLDVLGDPLLHVTISEERTADDGKTSRQDVEKLLPVDQALDHLPLPKEGDLSFSCEVEIKPTFELPELKKIPVERSQLEVTDEDVDAEIRRRLMLRGTYHPLEGGEVESDDLLVGSTKVTVEGEVVKTEANAELAARDQWYAGMHLEGFGAAVTGKKVGQSASCEVTVSEDHAEVEWRGKKATFEFSILDIKRLEVPELDAEMISSMGFDTAEEYRDFVKEVMKLRLEEDNRREMCAQIEQYLLDNTELEVPSGISQRQTERIVSRRMMDLYSRGVAESEITKKADEMRSAAAEQAREDLKHFFIMEKIAEEREVSVNEEELNAAIAEIAERRNRRFDRVRDEIISTSQLNTLYLRLRERKILEMLLADADVTDKQVPKKKSGPARKKKGTAKKTKGSTKGAKD